MEHLEDLGISPEPQVLSSVILYVCHNGEWWGE